MSGFWTYMMASGRYGYLYVGMTNDLARRVAEHKAGEIDGYTREHGCDQLVWYEPHPYVNNAILREKRIKRWLRDWKYALVEKENPQWLDLSSSLGDRPARRPDQP